MAWIYLIAVGLFEIGFKSGASGLGRREFIELLAAR
jgi:hypothetical protein